MYLVDESYELIELRDGRAILRNVKTGAEIERRLVVNVNDGVLRIARTAPQESDRDRAAA